MKKVTVKFNQTVYDVAIEQYGTCEAVGEIIDNNPELTNTNSDFCFDMALRADSTLLINTDSRLIKKNILRDIDKEVTTFDLKDYGTND